MNEFHCAAVYKGKSTAKMERKTQSQFKKKMCFSVCESDIVGLMMDFKCSASLILIDKPATLQSFYSCCSQIVDTKDGIFC